MSVLVTGGAGYIGSHAVRALLDRGEAVTVLDRLDHGVVPPTGAPLVVGDVADEALVARVLQDHAVEAVLHFAALKSAPESLRDPSSYFAENVGGSAALLRACVAHGVRTFVLSSSCAVYGIPERLPVTEEHPMRPQTPYGESKALVERMLPWFERAHGLRYASLRYFNAAGADPAGDLHEEWDDAPNLIPAVLRAAFTGRPVQIFGTDLPTPDGTAVRDYVHVADLAAAHLAALDRLRAGGDSLAVNLGTGTGSSVRQVVDAARRITGRAIPVIESPARAGDPPAVWADPTRAHAELGWRATRTLDDMLETAWRAGISNHEDRAVPGLATEPARGTLGGGRAARHRRPSVVATSAVPDAGGER